MEDFDDKMIWDALLRQAEANLRLSESILRQAVANEGTSSTIRQLTQRMLCKENAAALEPDRLDAWYAADGDAETVTSLAGQIVQQAGSCWPEAVGGRDVQHSSPPLIHKLVGKQVVGTKRRVPSVIDLLVKQPPNGAEIEVASTTAECGRATSEDGEADEARDGADKGRGANKPTTAKSGKKAAAEKVATKEATAAKAADQKAAAEEAAAEKAAAAKVAVEKADDGSSGSQPGMRNTPEGAGPEAIDGNGPQPLALESLPEAGGSASTDIQVCELPRPPDDTADAAGGGKADKAKHVTDARELAAKMLQVQQECVRTLRAKGIKIPANELPRPPEDSRECDDAVKAQNGSSAIGGSSKAAHYADRAAKTRFRKGAVKLRGYWTLAEEKGSIIAYIAS
jgi:hypothetical protein